MCVVYLGVFIYDNRTYSTSTEDMHFFVVCVFAIFISAVSHYSLLGGMKKTSFRYLFNSLRARVTNLWHFERQDQPYIKTNAHCFFPNTPSPHSEARGLFLCALICVQILSQNWYYRSDDACQTWVKNRRHIWECVRLQTIPFNSDCEYRIPTHNTTHIHIHMYKHTLAL